MSDTAPSSEQSNTKKKWLIGCGGCLGAVIILGIILAVLVMFGFNSCQKASQGAINQVLGPQYKAPEGSTAIGLPWGQNDLKNVIMIVNQQTGLTMFVIDTVVPADVSQVLKSEDPEKISAFIRQISSKAISGPGHKQTKVDVSNLKIESIHTVKLPNKKSLPFCHAKTYQKENNTYGPAVVALLPESKNRVIVLLSLDPRNTSTDPKSHFKLAYQTLERELFRLIIESDLDDRMQ